MFRCQMCDGVVAKGVRGQRVVVQTRRKEYAPRGSEPHYGRRFIRRGRPQRKRTYDKGGEGTEIVRELMVCPTCAESHNIAQATTTTSSSAE